MSRRRFAIAAGLVGLPSLLFVTYSVVWRAPQAISSTPFSIARPSTKVDSSTVEDVARILADRAEHQWKDNGIDAPLAQVLSRDLERFMPALVASDPNGYEAFMSQRGASLNDERANKILRVYLAKRYSTVPDADWSSAPVRELNRIAWQRPAEREARWATIGTDAVRAGRGWALSGEETAKGSAIAMTMYDVPDWKDLVRGAQRGEIPSAWIQFPAGFESNRAAEIRLTFVYHSGREKWMPMRLDILGPYPKPFLLF